MKFIKVLPEGLIDRIAAGEVIENPASVIKELVENSIDAGARNIEISVNGGGKDEILIVDDGEGIPKDQVELAFYRHATSKIRSWDDLLQASSMGFRGEALPSISSVSIMELSASCQDEKIGTSIKFDGGKQVFLGPAPPRKGCAISVRNLFYNVPARRKFLKSDTSERRKIAEILRRYFIAHPEIGFKVYYDGRAISTLPATDNLLVRLEAVWGDAITASLLELKEPRVGPLQITGFISSPETTRATRSEIFFFVNKRPVLERALFGAIAASYGRTLPPGRFPYAAVFLEIDPNFVDINVHPAKTEVRFADEGFIFTTLKRALDKTLALPLGVSLARGQAPAASFPPPIHAAETTHDMQGVRKAQSDVFHSHEDVSMSQLPRESPVADAASCSRGLESVAEDSFIQLFDTYFITRRDGNLLIIDQHTAHERILFERNLAGFNERGMPSQKLLFEEMLKLTPDEAVILEEISPMLSKAGFEIRPFGPDEIIISGLPQDMGALAPQNAFREVLTLYALYIKEGKELKYALSAALACKAAVKAGQRLNAPQMKALYHDLYRCQEPFRCPHGRPTIVILSRDDLEKIFRRK